MPPTGRAGVSSGLLLASVNPTAPMSGCLSGQCDVHRSQNGVGKAGHPEVGEGCSRSNRLCAAAQKVLCSSKGGGRELPRCCSTARSSPFLLPSSPPSLFCDVLFPQSCVLCDNFPPFQCRNYMASEHRSVTSAYQPYPISCAEALSCATSITRLFMRGVRYCQ